ncbi:MAG TPA: transglycosylase domain-containing protein [Bacillota bacterium]|nr:transglycosylase domain-containing protein [Bacillota bacterium]
MDGRIKRRQLHKRKIWLFVIVTIFTLSVLCYLFILFGGRLFIHTDKFTLDEKTLIVNEEDEIIWELFEENRTVVPLDDIPEHVQQAFVAIEDRRFYEHGGIDGKSVARAIYRDIVSRNKSEGASTITQQLAKNLFLYNEKTWTRKGKEALIAIYLERNFTKDEILEMYLNKIYFGHGVYGVEEAAQFYFNQSIADVSRAEGALLAGVIKAPTYYSPVNDFDKALNRRNTVLSSMHDLAFISEEELNEAEREELVIPREKEQLSQSNAGYIDLVLKEAAETYNLPIKDLKTGGYRIETTLQKNVQKTALEHFQKDEYFLGSTDDVEGSFVMMDESTGAVVASIGGRNFQFGDLNRATIKRQPGSTIKPLVVFGPALMTDNYNLYSLIRDEDLSYDDYVVSNSDKTYSGATTLYDSIVHSKNASTVWLFNEIGIDYGKEFLEKMAIDLTDDGLAVALGGLEEGISPLEMAGAYRTFSHNGFYVKPFTINEIYNRSGELIVSHRQEEVSVYSEQVAWEMTKVLQAAVQHGTGKSGVYSKDLAGKTGTTEHPFVEGKYKDAWFVGYTPEYVTSMWIGYDRSDRDHYLSAGSERATVLTKDILTSLDQAMDFKPSFEKPDGVEDLPDPIVLTDITAIEGKYILGGTDMIKGKITWEVTGDPRTEYHIYRVHEETTDEKIGEVTGESEYTLDSVSLFDTTEYYVVPYNPLTKMWGNSSEKVKLSF